LEEILKRPTAGQVNTDATSGFADARPDFEQRFDLCGAHRRRKLQAKHVDEVVAESIGSESVAAQAVSGKTILEFLNAVLTLPAIVIEDKNGTAAAFQVGDQETQVATGMSMFGLVADASLMRPTASAIAKAGKGALWLAGSAIPFRETMLPPLRCTLQPRVGAYADGLLQAEKLAEFIEQWQGQTSVRA
jgi:hypothetical protein